MCAMRSCHGAYLALPRAGARSCSGAAADTTTSAARAAAAAAAGAEVDATLLAARARRIQRDERVWRWLRWLVVPSFAGYALFLLRPTEGHFVRYLAERRYYERAFDQLFPPVLSAEEATATDKAHDVIVHTVPHATRSTRYNKSGRSDDYSSTTPSDYVWYTQRLKTTATDEDAERLARRRRLFSADAYTATQSHNDSHAHHDDDDAVTAAAATRRTDVSQTNAVPAHVLSAQLRHYLAQAKQYRASQHEQQTLSTQTTRGTHDSPPRTVDAPVVDIDFRDYKLFATGHVRLRDAHAKQQLSLRFVGVCGMLWKELARQMTTTTEAKNATQ